jgi:CheY-like chemotaxis protein/tetratricopeptide (TPR) repeat protein
VPSDVLIVEDDRQLAATLVRAVEQVGYTCRAVHDGNAALEAVGKQRPAGILLDLLLPKKDGRAVLEALQAAEATRSIPVIVMSGVFRGRDQQAAMQKAGARAFLEKPFSMQALQQALLASLGRPRREEAGESVEQQAPDQIDLTRVCVADVIWRAIAERFSGALHFKHRQRHKVLLLREGQPVLVRSNLAREALGRRLLAAGRIDERALNESLRRSKTTGKKQGECLVEMGAISRRELERLLLDQASDKLLELFSWTAGASWRQEGVAELGLATDLSGWSQQRMMIEGCLRTDPELLQRVLAPYQRCRVEAGDVELEPGCEKFGAHALLSRLERPVPVSDLTREFLPVLFALWRIGAVEIEGTLAAVELPAAPVRSSQLAELRARLEEIAGLDHFEVLGVARGASSGEVRKAFVEQAKTCHPDKLANADSELRELSARLFARLSQAHEVLADPKQRDAYVRQLATGAGKTADRVEVSRILNAEQLFQKADGQARRKEWGAAIETLREALRLDAEEGEFHALLGWSLFMQDPQAPAARAAGIDALRKAISLGPNSPSGYFYLGRLHRICEQLPEAERMFRKILELRPQHAEAAQELRLIERRKNERSTGKGLFGIGKKK